MAPSRSRSLGAGEWMVALATLLTTLGGCSCEAGPVEVVDTGGTDGGPPRDTGPRIDSATDTGPAIDSGARCGDGEPQGTEECDDGNTLANDGCTECRLDCGDGVVTGSEICDTSIAAGDEGACPTDCDDGMSCTSDSLSGADCSAVCEHGDITAIANGDGCCPDGADATSDDDCDAVCGNALLEAGETCDTGIASGAGSCPATCDDGIACTTDASSGSACTFACTNTAITTAAPGDGCCPSGATPATDTDCTGCGDGVVTPPETCEPTGSPMCPTSCNDGMACTTDVLVGGGTCSAACMFTPITAMVAGDGCCPTGGTIATDSDCAARCGDRVITAPETCDDGNTTPGDGCSGACITETVAPTVFRVSDLDIRDPHLFATVFFCVDVTNAPLGMDGVNVLLQNSITRDEGPDDMPDGDLDLSITEIFSPLVQTAGGTTPTYVSFPECSAPIASTMCVLPAGGMRTASVTATSSGGTTACVSALASTTRASYTPTLVFPTASAGGNCYAMDAGTISFSLGGIPITLLQSTIGGEWVGNPATSIRDGVIRGFMPYASARATIIPEGTTGMDGIDGMPLSSLLRTRSTSGALAGACGSSASASDLDTGPDGAGGTTDGWWFYLNFTADARPYREL